MHSMIMNNILRLRFGKYENQLFIRMLLMVTLPLLVMGIIAYHIYVSGERKRSLESLGASCQSLSQSYDNVFSQVRDYYLNIISTQEYQWLNQQEEIPYSQYLELKAAIERLRGNHYLTRYTGNYNYLNVKYGWVLNNYGMFLIEDARNREALMAFLEAEEQLPVTVRWSNRRDEKSPYDATAISSRVVDFTGEQLVIKETGLDGAIRHLLLIKINQQELENLAAGFKNSGYEVAVISDGKAAVQTSEAFSQAVLSGGEAETGIYAGERGQRYQVSRMPLTGHNITCYVGYDINVFQKNGRVFLVAALVFAACLAILMLAVRCLALYFSRPVISLQQQVDVQNSRIRELLVSDLIAGGMTDEKIAESLEKLETKPAACYRMIGMMAKQKNGYDKIELERMRIHLPDIPDEVQAQMFLPAVIYRNMLLVLVGAEDEYHLDEKTATIYKQLKDWASRQSGHAIASGVSQMFTSLCHMDRAQQECSEALHNKQNQKDELSSLVLYDDYRTRDYIRNAYDMIVENELTNAVANGNEAEAGHLLERCIERLEQFNVTGLERNLYVVRLLTAIMSVPGNAGIPVSEIFGSGQYNIINQASQIYNKKKLLAYVMTEIMQPIMQTLTARAQSEASEIVKQVMHLIKEEKGTITLNECADRLSYHPNYIWKVLKTEKKVTFTELANEERLELAKYMLLTSDDSIAVISDKLKYNNVQNFIRFFKAQVGSTPAAFRKAHKS